GVTPELCGPETLLAMVATHKDSNLDQFRKQESHLDGIWTRSFNSLVKLQTLRLGARPVYNHSIETIEPDEGQSNFEDSVPFTFSVPVETSAKPEEPASTAAENVKPPEEEPLAA